MSDAARQHRAAEREARAWLDLADALERVWIAKFGRVAVVVEPTLAEMRRRGGR